MSATNLKILSVVGARPNFMKVASLAKAIDGHNEQKKSPLIDHIIVHTGQHYDEKMSKLFFDELEIPRPAYNLEVGSGSHAYQTAEIIKRLEPVVLQERPDFVLVVGDVNSTFAGAFVASKLEMKIIHVEAGLRSFDRSMPEEINRVLTDAISDLLFTTEQGAEENLIREGIAKDKIYFVGNVMIDTLLKHKEKSDHSTILKQLDIKPHKYGVVTLHRPSNVDNRENLKNILDALKEIDRDLPIIFPVHPRTREKIIEFGIDRLKGIIIIEPLGYLDFLKLMKESRIVFTDSGGIQEETTVLRIPCITLRENTERPVTITSGTNVLVGTDKGKIIREAQQRLNSHRCEYSIPPLWDGKAAERIVNVIIKHALT